MKEALSIRTTPEDARFNGDSGCEPPDLWIATFKKLKGAMVLSFRAESFSTTATYSFIFAVWGCDQNCLFK